MRWVFAAAMFWAGPIFADPLIVFAASSLKAPLDVVARDYEAVTGQEVRVSYAASSTLARQIGFGAPADVFVTADPAWMEYLSEQTLVNPAQVIEIAGNSLVIAAPAPAPEFNLTGPEILDALAGGRLAVPLIDAVPLGKYAAQAFDNMNVLEELRLSLAQQENAQSTVVTLLRGEVPLAVLYASDLVQQSDLGVVTAIPTDLHDPVRYQAAALQDGTAGDGFVTALQGAKAQRIFQQFGYIAP